MNKGGEFVIQFVLLCASFTACWSINRDDKQVAFDVTIVWNVN